MRDAVDHVEPGRFEGRRQARLVVHVRGAAVLEPTRRPTLQRLALGRAQVIRMQSLDDDVTAWAQDAALLPMCRRASRFEQVTRAVDVQHRVERAVGQRQGRRVRQDALAQPLQDVEAHIQAHRIDARRLQGAQQLAVAAAQLQDASTQPRSQVREGALTAPRRLVGVVEPVPWIRRATHSASTAKNLIRKARLEPTMARRRNKGEERAVAKRRIDTLLAVAEREAAGPDADLAHAHARTARRIALRYQMKPPALKALTCRKCGVLRTSTTTRVRLRGRITTTCTCGHIHRRPLP